jgi:hypothetical protein
MRLESKTPISTYGVLRSLSRCDTQKNDRKREKAMRVGKSKSDRLLPSSPLVPRYMPDARECALLLLRLIEAKADGAKPLSRFRVAEISLRRMWGRQRITQEFIGDVNDWLFRAGRVLFFTGSSYGVISISVVESWSGLTSKLISTETSQALAGKYDFTVLEDLLSVKEEADENDI